MSVDAPVHGPRNSVILAILALGGFVAVAAFFPSPDEDYGAAIGLLASGIRMTVFISIVTCVGGAGLAMLLVAADLGRFALPRALARADITFFRGTPLIAQLYLVYYGAGEISRFLDSMHLWWLFKGPLGCVIMVFILNTAAYQAHVVAGAVRALPKEQKDAALALGLSARATMFKVLLPQAMLVALRPLGNEATKMVKASAIASVVTVLDLLGTARILFSETLDFSYLFIAACIYLVLIGIVRMAFERLEDRFLRHMALKPVGGAVAVRTG